MFTRVSRYRNTIAALVTLAPLMCVAQTLSARQQAPDAVTEIFTKSCLRCHGERVASAGLDLTPASLLSATVEAPSSQDPEHTLISPGSPERSYLFMKITGAPGITGNTMPPGNSLAAGEITTIRNWISGLTAGSGSESAGPAPVRAFAGWKAGNSPTAEILGPRQILFSISHRFVPTVGEGYDRFYGIDGPAVIMLTVGYSPVRNLMLGLGRSNADDTLELSARYRLIRETAEVPLSLAVQADVNWETHDTPEYDRYRNEAFSWVMQAIATLNFHDRYSIGTSPAILFNPNTKRSDEDPLVAIGLMGRVKMTDAWSIIGDVVPIVSGFSSTRSAYGFYDSYNRFDAWTIGVERNIGVHVFQLFATNSESISSGHYLNGGDLDIGDGDLRLGFVIYSIIGI